MQLFKQNKYYAQVENLSQLLVQIPNVPSFNNEEQKVIMDEISLEAVLVSLDEMGLKELLSNAYDVVVWCEKLVIIEKYQALFDELIRSLVHADFLVFVNGVLQLSEKGEKVLEASTWSLDLQKLGIQSEEYKPHTDLLLLCMESLPSILRGKVVATSVLFPEGDLKLVAPIYKGNYQADFFNNLLADSILHTVEQGVKTLSETEKIKIIEVGAGTGGSTELILEKLYPFRERIEYVFTDLSHSFLINAENRFKNFGSGFKTALLNVENSIENQGFDQGVFDVLIGANVLHATKNIVTSLTALKPLLKKDGILILNELAKNELFTTLTFGLLDGWWLFEDHSIRLKGSPGLSAEGWETAFLETGFHSINSLPLNNKNLAQQILIAKSDGWVLKTIPQISKIVEKEAIKAKNNKLSKPIVRRGVEEIANTIIKIAADTVKLPEEEFDLQEQFTEYGFDSILGTTFMKNVSDHFGITLKATDIFNYPNVEKLANYIAAEFDIHALCEEEDVTVEVNYVHDEKIKIKQSLNSIQSEIKSDLLSESSHDIAVIGMSAQFAGANNLDEFWDALWNGKSLIKEVPENKWDLEQDYDCDTSVPNKTYSKWGGFIEDVDKFDPLFFKISGSEAETMDPQQRLFLQHCWSAFEDAAINPEKLKDRKCGVFVGVGAGDYITDIDNKPATAFWGNSSSILASRISYFLDLKGPAISIDTACSSSLVALNLACSSLEKKETDIMLAGGVSIMHTANFYKLSSRAGMLSPEGKCYAFDARANGFVPGEGIGVVVLKRLEDAVRDKDPIYGVIKGSLTNQDGTTNGIVAPSSVSQVQLEKEVYDRFGIDPETISYIETHGTGTSLGDPIEFDALKASFKSYTQRNNFCSIGSVKTNIGHTLMAAGVAGLVKVMLSLSKKKLPPTLNFESINPLIQLENSPFKIQTEKDEWYVPENNIRRAAISSFGFSGTNAHMIVEEFPEDEIINSSSVENKNQLIILSAKNKERLNARIVQLIHFIEKTDNLKLADVAFTLQIGREEMEERAGFVCHSMNDALLKLKNIINGDFTEIQRGNAKDDGHEIEILKEIITDGFIEKCIEKNEYSKLIKFWCKGLHIDWNVLHQGPLPRKIHLPTYPFAKESYWIKNRLLKKEVNPIIGGTKVHPLIHENTSTVNEWIYTSILNGNESFLRDHKVHTDSILPGVAHLEMARETGTRLIGKAVTRITDVNWLSPIWVKEQSKTVMTKVNFDDQIGAYKIISKDNLSEVIHSQGKLHYNSLNTRYCSDLLSIQGRLSNQLSQEEFYQYFMSKGLNLGRSFKGVKKMFFSDEEALSFIELPVLEGCFLTPGLLDSTLQTGLGMHLSNMNDEGLSVPFSVKEIRMYESLPERIWSYIRYSEGSGKNSTLKSYDVDVFDENGKILVEFRKFTVLPLEKKIENSVQTNSSAITSYFTTNWKETELQKMSYNEGIENKIIVFNANLQLTDLLKERLETEVESIFYTDEQSLFIDIYRQIKFCLQKSAKFRLTILYKQDDRLEVGFLVGLLKSASLESNNFTFQLIGIDEFTINELSKIENILLTEVQSNDQEVKYIDNRRFVNTINEMKSFEIKLRTDKFQKKDGVYIITGGTGGLGRLFAEHLVQSYGGKVVLIGRKELNKEEVVELKSKGEIHYYSCDITQVNQVSEMIQFVEKEYGSITGIIHSAGITKDNLIINKTEEEIKDVLSVKINGLKNIIQSTKRSNIDFLMLFSSISSIYGNAGQSDYAAANAFLDQFSESYEQKNNLEIKRVISLNWPLWENGGMKLSQVTLDQLFKKWGIVPIPDSIGLEIFDQMLAQKDLNRLIISHGLNPNNLPVSPVKKQEDIKKIVSENEKIETEDLQNLVTENIKQIVSDLLKINTSAIRVDRELGDYGFDSILMTQFAERVSEFYGCELTPTLFFNYPTIKGLAVFLVQEHSVEVQNSHFKKNENPVFTALDENKFSTEGLPDFFKQNKESVHNYIIDQQNNESAVAIIGMDARFPGSPSVKAFWENLKANKDLITEIPEDRWDWKEYYGDPIREKNKTKAKWGGFIDDIDKFDPLFFNISPREAVLMDPQQRISLESVYHALEDAGITRAQVKGSNTGVFMGVSTSDYSILYNKNTDLEKEALYSTGSAHSVLANRISYLFDLHGPSEPIDTACSSALVAIHRAVENIKNGHCNMAIAGGVNAILSPEVTFSFSQAGMLSEEGRCKTFDQSANGYVRGEGVGTLVLKKLSLAEADGDRIYAVIKGTAENHGGKANSLTSPNPNAQKDLLVKVYSSNNIDPRDIGYIEAHGTGTSLGDPVEIDGLNRAFKELYQQKGITFSGDPYCGISSVKTNIGHLEAAAGVAGVIKAVLSIKNKILPGNPHLNTVNNFLNIRNSPLYLLKDTVDWNINEGKKRIAGISSFGFGGANAHIIVEEYEQKKTKVEHDQVSSIIVPISANTKIQLRSQVENLKSWIADNNNFSLSDLAFTYQTGRESMKERLAFVCISKEDLMNQCADYLGNDIVRFTGTIDEDVFSDEINFYLSDGEDDVKIAEYWCQGKQIDWRSLYKLNKPQRISVPTYPFLRDRYWIPTKKLNTIQKQNVLHPLLHRNDSNFQEQQYESTFDGSEHFLVDHKVLGEKILPGVAYIEMIREAGFRSMQKKVSKVNGITWLSPIVMKNTPLTVTTKLFDHEKEQLRFEVWSFDGENTILNSKGFMVFEAENTRLNVDVNELKNRLSKVKNQENFYLEFTNLGLELGTSFRGVKEYYYSEKEGLSLIQLSDSGTYSLNPGILDSALQTCAGLNFELKDKQLALPYSVREVIINDDLKKECWAYARESEKDSENSIVKHYDIDLLDFSGKSIVSFREIAAVPIQAGQSSLLSGNRGISETIFVSESWVESSLLRSDKAHVFEKKHIILDEYFEYLKNDLSQEEGTTVLVGLGENQESKFINLFEIIKKNISNKEKNQLLIVIPEINFHEYAFLAELIKTAKLEYSSTAVSIISIDKESQSSDHLVADLLSEIHSEDVLIKYSKGKRWIKKHVIDQQIEKSIENSVIRQNGVYLITGGSGSLAKIIAKHISQTENTRTIMLGRRKLTIDEEENLKKIVGVEYHQIELSDKNSLELFITDLTDKYGHINGIVHASGISKDNFIINKSIEEIRDVFESKVNVLKVIDEVTKDEPLDFVMLFSSLAGLLGNPGQSDYAAANSYLMDFSTWRNEQLKLGKRKGKSIAIGWPLWENGGMKVEKDIESILERQWGMKALPTPNGVEIFDYFLKNNIEKGYVLYGDRQKIIDTILFSKPVISNIKVNKPDFNGNEMHTIVADNVLRILSEILMIDESHIERDNKLGDYGFDSILLARFSNELNDYYGISIMPTVFFNHPTVNGLAGYLIDEHPDKIGIKHVIHEEEIQSMDKKAEIDHLISNDRFEFQNIDSVNDEGVAIIGMSARFPNSPDLDIFWDNLKQNKNLVTEIPEDRWDWKEYYGDPTKEKNKTFAKWGGFITDIDKFDASFFGLSPREAEMMDPQQRITLESVYAALQDAAIPFESLKGTDTGVFVGVSGLDYSVLFNNRPGMDRDAMLSTGSAHSILANRISYLLDINGPSEPVDTACSSSLIAVHRAFQHIKRGECKIAIAGGVNAILSPDVTLSFSQAGMLAPDGKCKTFDESANGYVRGEGVGIIIMKKLSEAIKDQDHIYGVVRNTAENHGGRANTLTSPNPLAQRDLLVKVYTDAKIDPRDIGYIEAHGTGTPLGDPIEMEGLKMTFTELYKRNNLVFSGDPYCAVGSVKTNIGHLESAAGIAGIVKTVLSINNKTIPGNPHIDQLNSLIRLDKTPLYVTRESKHWEVEEGKKRIAGISSFGFGGANAHIIIEEFVQPEFQFKDSLSPEDSAVIVLSAKTKDILKKQVGLLVDYCVKHPETNIHQLGYSLMFGRTQMEERLAFSTTNLEDLKNQLNKILIGEEGNVFRGNIKSSEIKIYSEGEAGKKLKKLAIETNDINTLLELWTKGVVISWSEIFGNKKFPKLNLPTYPFARERHWLFDDTKQSKTTSPNNKIHSRLELPEILKRTLADVLHLDCEEIDENVAFHEMGLDSVLVNLYKMELSKFVEDIPLKAFIENDTITKLSDFILSNDVVTSVKCEKRLSTKIEGQAYVETLAESTTSDEVLWLIPGMPGVVSTYVNWSESMTDKFTVKGINWKGVLGESSLFTSIEEIATFNVNLIEKLLGSKKINLIGHSYGALIVYEMARQFLQKGKRINQLIIVEGDAGFLRQSYSEKMKLELFFKSIDREKQISKRKLSTIMKNINKLDRSLHLAKIKEVLLKEKLIDISKSKSIDPLYGLFSVAMDVFYDPNEKLEINALLVKSDSDNFFNSKDEYLGWSNLFQDVESIVLEGNHFSILDSGREKLSTRLKAVKKEVNHEFRLANLN